MLANLAEQDDAPVQKKGALLREALSQYRMATTLLDRYSVRTPRLVTFSYFNLARVSVILRDDGVFRLDAAISSANRAKRIARDYEMRDLEAAAQEMVGIATGWIGIRKGSSESTCEGVREWYKTTRMRTSVKVYLAPAQQHAELDEVLLRYRRSNRTSFEKCLNGLEVDVERVNRDLDKLDAQRGYL
jgi:hypothetical protein